MWLFFKKWKKNEDILKFWKTDYALWTMGSHSSMNFSLFFGVTYADILTKSYES